MDVIDDWVRRAAMSRAIWLEGILKNLLSTDMPTEDIEIQEHPDHRTVVAIRGVPRYEWKIAFI